MAHGSTARPGERADAAAGWRERLQAALRGSAPRHARHEWIFPGLDHARSQALAAHFPPDPTPAAVLIPIIERDEPAVLFTHRAAALRHHAGQISFPGGRIETDDPDPASAALRETHEEIGLEPSQVRLAGFLPDHILITGFRVTPVVGLVQPGFTLALDTSEVASSFEVPLAVILDPAHQQVRRWRLPGGEEVDVSDIHHAGHVIWGATAGMLATLRRLLAPVPDA